MKDDCNNDRLIEAWAAYHAHLETNGIAVPTEVREPKSVDLEAPLLGLGEDYEQEIYAFPKYDRSQAPMEFVRLVEGGTIAGFLCAADCPPTPNSVRFMSVDEIKAHRGRLDRQVAVMDAELNILKTWPL